MKKSILFLSLSILALSLVSCNGGASNPQDVKQLEVIFSGTDLPVEKVSTGYSLLEPTSPEKDGYFFDDWYLDGSYTKKATFPLVVNNDLTLYAKYIDNVTYFNLARAKTITDASSFSYSYMTKASALIAGTTYKLEGKTDGSVKYNEKTNVSYLDEHVNSGVLFNDGTLYEYKKGDNVYKINLNEKNEVVKFKFENTPSFKYESSSFAKSLFSYEDSDIKGLIKVNNNQYALKTTSNFSSISAVVASDIDNPIVKSIFEVNIPETDANFKQYISFDADGFLKNYTYSFRIDVSKVEFELSYTLNFTSINSSNLVINEPNIDNLIIGEKEVSDNLNVIKSNVETYKALSNSVYDFELKTELDEGVTSLARTATVKGKTKRNVNDGTVYYNNKIEVDSNYKSNDFYGDKVEDYKRTRGVLSDKTVYDVEDKVFKDEGTQVQVPLDSDEYYFLPENSLLNATGVGAITKKVDKGVTSYYLIANNIFIEKYFDSINSLVRLDCTLKNNIKVLGTYQKDSLEISNSKFVYSFNNNDLVSIIVDLEGNFVTTLEGTNTPYVNKNVNFKVNLNLTITDDGKDYQVPEKFKDLLK